MKAKKNTKYLVDEFLDYKKVNELLQSLNYSKNMDESQVIKIFVQVLDKFFKQKISIEVLDAIANDIYWKDGVHKNFIKLDFLNAVESAAELTYTIKQLQKESNFDDLLQKHIAPLKKFYEANKSLL